MLKRGEASNMLVHVALQVVSFVQQKSLTFLKLVVILQMFSTKCFLLKFSVKIPNFVSV